MNYIIEIVLISYLMSGACIFIGAFWLVRQKTFLSDSVGHSVLLGIVLFYLLFGEIYGWGSYVAAIASGCLNIFLVDFLTKKKWFSRDVAMSLTMIFFLALAIVLITKFADKVHLDQDAIMLGNLTLGVLDRFYLFGYDMGSKALYKILVVFLMNAAFVGIYYRQMVLQSFDIHFVKETKRFDKKVEFLFIFLCSTTVVVALDLVGIILVVAFFITPVATAFLLSKKRFWHIFPWAFMVQGVALPVGYSFSYWGNVSVASSMVAVMTILFFLVLLLKRNTA